MTRRRWMRVGLAWAAPLRAGGITVDSDGMLQVDGRREFIAGTYMLPAVPEPWKEVAGAGFGLVHTAPRREELDQAAAHGLRAWVTLGSVAPQTRQADESRIRRIVAELKDHPALLLWETEDEPSYQYQKSGPRVPPKNLETAVKLVRSLGAAHPFFLNHAPANLVSTLAAYNHASDVVATDIYPVIPRGIRPQYGLWPDGMHGDLSNIFISQVGQYTRKMRQVAGESRAVWMVLQAFAWEDLRQPGDRDPGMVLYPSRAELRFMVFQAIANGATGILFWGLKHARREFWPELKAVVSEVRSLASELSARRSPLRLDIDYHDTGHSLDAGIEWIARGSALIAVNADRYPVEATLRTARRAWRERFEPFGVRIYRGAV